MTCLASIDHPDNVSTNDPYAWEWDSGSVVCVLRDYHQVSVSYSRQLAHVRSHVFSYSSYIDYIENLDDSRYTLLRKIPLRINRDEEGGWTAFVEASTIGMPGDTREQAVEELKGAVLDIYEEYSDDPEILGPGPAREWAVLQRYIRHR